MWRWLYGLPRAVRHHFYNPRTSAGVYVEEEQQAVKQSNDQHNKQSCQQTNTFCSFQEEKKEDWSKNGPDCEKFDFWSIVNGPQTALEAFGWGGALVLGIELTKNQHHYKCWQQTTKPSNHSLLYTVAYALPRDTAKCKQHIKSVLETDKKKHEDTGQPPTKVCKDSLDKVMADFECICKKYAATGKGMQGLCEANKGNLTGAVEYWQHASDMGHSKSRFNLAVCYETGKGVKKDLKKAVEIYRLATEEGHPQAMYNLAVIYLEGRGSIKQDPQSAIELLEKAASFGLAQAQTFLGVYFTEEGSQDFTKAVSYFASAASNNDPEAQFFLGICHEQGLGVEQNDCKAVHWYSQASQSGHDGALFNLALFHLHGLGGLPEDRFTAKELLEKAHQAGSDNAKLKLMEMRTEETLANWSDKNAKDLLEKCEDKNSPQHSTAPLSHYVRNHLSELCTPASTPLTKLCSKILAGQSSSHLINLPSREQQRQIVFSLGACEDDLETLSSLANRRVYSKDYTELRWEPALAPVLTPPPHHCSVLQKNATVRDLQCISCS